MNIESLVLPKGAVLLKDLDNKRSKATASRLGLYSGIEAELKSTNRPLGVAGIERCGDWIVAVLAWKHCKSGNGWATLSISPATCETMAFLARLVQTILDEQPTMNP